MIPIEEAQQRVVVFVPAARSRRGPVGDALGQVVAVDVASAEDVPPFANTAVDGYAVQAADTAARAGRAATWSATLAAGAAPTIAVGAGEAVRIMTGAPMPPAPTPS